LQASGGAHWRLSHPAAPRPRRHTHAAAAPRRSGAVRWAAHCRCRTPPSASSDC